MIKIALFRVYESYKAVMDANVNPLRHIPDPVSRFWVMTVLSWMWCAASGIYVGSVLFVGASFVGHVALLFMVFLTAAVFYDAEQRQDSWLAQIKIESKSTGSR
tara:strand:- start:156 stop:467 length:312 start_codon:yes stop_codon:yes gene_type:complete